MIRKVVDFALNNRFLVLAAALMLFVWGGYLFGNIPLVKAHFGLVTIGIIGVSMLPFVSLLLRRPAHSP